MLAVCAVIGFYFGFIEKKQKRKQQGQQEVPQDEKDGGDGAGAAGIEERRGSEALDYLVGGRKMKVFPVALSLVARWVTTTFALCKCDCGGCVCVVAWPSWGQLDIRGSFYGLAD